MKKRWEVRSHINERQDRLPEEEDCHLSEKKNAGKSQERQYRFGTQEIKVNPEQRRGIFLLFLSKPQGLCSGALWVSTEAGSSTWQCLRQGEASPRTPSLGVAQRVFCK